MKLTMTSVDELVSVLNLVKDTAADTSAQYPDAHFDFQFVLQSNPASGITNSEAASRLEALAAAVRKFAGDEQIAWAVALGVSNPINNQFSQTLNARMEAKQSLKESLAGGKLAVLPQGK